MRIHKLIIGAGLLAMPVAATVLNMGGAEAVGSISGPCKVQVGSPGPSVGTPTVSVNPSTGEVYFRAPHVDSGHLDPHVECFSGVIID